MANHHHLARTVEEFMKLDSGMTLFQMRAFLLVACNPGQTQNWIEKQLGTSNATASRTLAKWSEYEKPGKPGLGMIETVIDPNDRRFRLVNLTSKGTAFLSTIKSKLGETNGAD